MADHTDTSTTQDSLGNTIIPPTGESNHNIKKTIKAPSIRLDLLPPEILFNIFSYLDTRDLDNLSVLSSKFHDLISDEELWKNLFKTKYDTLYFPSYSFSDKFSNEYIKRNNAIRSWKHNRTIKTKYIISPNAYNQNQIQFEKIIFNYPKCIVYNDGIITIIQLSNNLDKRKKPRITYIPCTTPQGCSKISFNSNSAIFGRFDGRIFGKLLNNKSYLQPVMEFNDRHSTDVTALANSLESIENTTNTNWSISGSKNGEIIWWNDTKLHKRLKLSNFSILKIEFWKTYTIILDEKFIYLIENMNIINSLPLSSIFLNDELDEQSHSEETLFDLQKLTFFKMDFGSMSLIMADINNIYIISMDLTNNFGYKRVIKIDSPIYEIKIDNNICNRKQNLDYVGNDDCPMAVLTMDNELFIYNIRSPTRTQIKPQVSLKFNKDVESILTCQISNLILIVAFAGYLNVYDILTGELIKVIQKTDKVPQFLSISQDKLIIASNNIIHHLQFISNNTTINKKHSNSTYRGRNNHNKWIETMNSELELFDENERLVRERFENEQPLLEQYNGSSSSLNINNVRIPNGIDDFDEDDYQLRIALMESQTLSTPDNTTNNAIPNANNNADVDEEELARAINESLRLQSGISNAREPLALTPSSIDDNEQLQRAIEESRQFQESLSFPNHDVIQARDLLSDDPEDDDDDDELRQAIEESRRINSDTTPSVSLPPNGTNSLTTLNTTATNFGSTDVRINGSDGVSRLNDIPSTPAEMSADEALQLAIALSLSEMN
ncbi:hypothetical protein TBLA_0B02980 [Henningerozyma blattae CBS 6284]|uniref:F-box domain-containing protein n=1 Tax=Henningerozyma blattae (strain ATCC 34711 / CBS 6284 / DSM 70876 / NBRC 10599 / NRRL Y-10934 / UCD 77-7) TaxID=1071380 RepID=I2GYD8_HENB6|nr:hypothetical protein TBLA_0B02980 [Tetrapisispora blattae CBS 6284]CCH59140.1 hypothetical protein TBLA_0B02980 [Tetrapisispora blattae CBS 6284]